MKNTKNTDHKDHQNHQSDNKDMAKKIALGATGVVITAGVVAAGAVLADQKMRGKVGRSLQGGAKNVGKIANQVKDSIDENYPAVSHSIGRGKTSTTKSSKRTSKES